MKENTCRVCKKQFVEPSMVLVGFKDCCNKCRPDQTLLKMNDSELRDALTTCGVDPQFSELNDSLYKARALKISKEALYGNTPLFLEGTIATGKSLTLSCLAKDLILRGTSVRYFNVGRLAVKCRSDNAYMDRLTPVLQKTRHVFFDDMGAIYDKTGWFSCWLLSIMDYRYSNKKPMSGSCNNPDCVEARCMRRIMEQARCIEFTVIEESK